MLALDSRALQVPPGRTVRGQPPYLQHRA